MATSLIVKIEGDTVDAISASIQPKSLNQGHQTFTVLLDNLDNKYGGLYHANDKIDIYIGELLIFSGAIDSIKHQLSCKEKWDWMDYLRISGRDNSYRLAGYKYTKTWAADEKIHIMVTEALEDTGCPMMVDETLSDSPTVGGHSIQDGYIFDLCRDLLAKANWYGEVKTWMPDHNMALYMYAMDDEDLVTGITLTNVLGIPNLIEEDGLEIRNYIEVFGAAVLTDPADKDAYTEDSLAGWGGGDLSNWGESAVGDYSIRCEAEPVEGFETTESFVQFYLLKNFGLLYGQNTVLKFMARNILGYDDSPRVRLYTTDEDYFEADVDFGDFDWHFNNLPLGPNNELSDANPEGIWTKVGDADWFNITKIEFYAHWNTLYSGNALAVDGLFLEPARPRGFAEDAVTSQPTYGKREITFVKDDLTTEAQVQAEADSKLEKLKDPAAFIPHIIARGSDFIADGEFLALPARLIDLDLPGLEFLDGTYRMENIVINIVPYENLNSGYDFTVEFDGVPEATKVDADAFEKVTKGRVLPIMKQLARNEFGFR
jgi:hypothetical protein